MSRKCRTFVKINGDYLRESCRICGHYYSLCRGRMAGCDIDDICDTMMTEAKRSGHCDEFVRPIDIVIPMTIYERKFSYAPYEIAYIKGKHGGYEYINPELEGVIKCD